MQELIDIWVEENVGFLSCPSFLWLCDHILSWFGWNPKVKLRKLHNSCVKFIFRIAELFHITEYRMRLGWMTVEQSVKNSVSCNIYKILVFNRPTYLREAIKLFAELPELKRSIRNKENDPKFTIHITTARIETLKILFNLWLLSMEWASIEYKNGWINEYF